VHATVIHRWKREALASMEAGFSETREKTHTDHKAQLDELRRGFKIRCFPEYSAV